MLFDDILEQIGEGIFQKFTIFVCGLAALAEAVATTSVPFAMVLVACDLQLSAFEVLSLNAVLIAGMLISGYWLGGVSDLSGRKYILSTTSILTFIGCFVASFSQCLIMLFVSLFLLGVGLGGNHCATRVFIIEITPKRRRGSRLAILEGFYSVGYVAAISLARLLVPPIPGTLGGNYIRLNSWRILFGLSGSLSIFSACLMSIFPASPRWLLGKKKEDDTISILRKIYAVNRVKHEETFPRITLDPITFVDTRAEGNVYQCNYSLIQSLRSIRVYTKYIFKKKLIKTTIASILIAAFTFDGIIMLNIWMGLILHYSDMENCTLNGAIPVWMNSTGKVCNPNALESLLEMNTYLSFCSFSVFVLAIIADKIPRKFILMMSTLMSGTAALFFIFMRSEAFLKPLAFVILILMSIGEVSFRIILLESYPTVLRSTAYGFIKLFSKVSLILLIMLLRTSCVWALSAFGFLFMLSSFLSAFLPNLNIKPMRE